MFEVEKKGMLGGWINTYYNSSDEWVEKEREERFEWARNNGFAIYIAREGCDYTGEGETKHYVAVKRLQDGLEIVPLFSTNRSWVKSGNAFPPTHFTFYKAQKIKVKRKLHPPLNSFKFRGVVFFPTS